MLNNLKFVSLKNKLTAFLVLSTISACITSQNISYADGFYGYPDTTKSTGPVYLDTSQTNKFTPKLQGLIRYDQFDPNKDIANNNRKEYVAGINYFIKGQALRLMLNYVFCQNEGLKDSHRVMLGTQILF